MKNNPLLIAIICGLIAAVLFISPLSLGSFGMALSFFTALPIFVSVLGFGTIAGIVSGAVASLIIAFMFGILGAAVVLIATLGPALWIGYSVGLSRNDDGQQEWFPLSLLLLRLATISAVVVIAMGLFTGYTQQWAIDQATAVMTEFMKVQAQAGSNVPVLSEAEIVERSTDIAKLIPFMMPVSVLFLMVINLRLAEKITRGSGLMLRPKDHLPTDTALPLYAVGIFVAGILGSVILGNQAGLIAQVVAGAFGGVFVLVGLATVHFMTMGLAARPFLLPFVYIALFISRIVAPVFAVLGVAETLLGLRARSASRNNKT